MTVDSLLEAMHKGKALIEKTDNFVGQSDGSDNNENGVYRN